MVLFKGIGKVLHERKSLKAFDQLKDGVKWTRPKEEDDFKKFIEQMLEREPEKRPSAKDCKKKLRKFIASDHGMLSTIMVMIITVI